MNDYLYTDAIYSEQKIEQYKGNSLIEALPDIIDEPIKLAKLLTRYPVYNEADRDLPALYRVQLVKNIENFFKPLSIHYNVEQIISRMIRFGYVNRNPVKSNNMANVYSWQKYSIIENITSTTPELAIFGISGIGKTTMIKNILSLYPKVIKHTNYKGDKTLRYQITWLMVQTPSNGSTKGICLNLLSQIDEIFGESVYYRKGVRKSTAELPEYIRSVVKLHSIGVIVFDELQNLRGLGSKKEEELLNFFVELSNTIETPIILVGTLKALPLFNREFRNVRRICGDEMIIWNKIHKDSEWKAFVEELFKFQWTKKPAQITDELINILYDESQGITDIVVKIFMLCQYRAISTGYEKITVSLIKSVVKDCLKLIKPMLDALRQEDEKKLSLYEDIYIKSKELNNILQAESKKVFISNNDDKAIQQVSEIVNNTNIEIDISSWLIQAGFSLKLSEKVSKKVVKESGKSENINLLKKKAYELISEYESNSSNNEIKGSSNIKADMLELIRPSIEKNEDSYKGLKEQQYVADIDEFI